MMFIFSASVYDVPDGYGLHVEVSEEVPQDIVRKIATEVAEQLNKAEFPEPGETLTTVAS